MVTIAVVGGSGFVARSLIPRLRADGHEVVALDRSGSAGQQCPDLADASADWASFLAGADVVINLAGLAHDVRRLSDDASSRYMAVNAKGAERIAIGARGAGAKRFVQISTTKVLGEQPADRRRFLESDPLRPVGVYAQSKAEGERLVFGALSGSPTEAIVVRLPLVFGQPFKGNLALMERAIRRRVPLPLGDERIGARTYVRAEDLGDLMAVIVAAEGLLPPVVHARSAPDLRAGDVARLVGGAIGRKPLLVKVPPAALRRTARLLGRSEMASKLCDEMLVSDTATREALSRLAG